MYYDFSITVPPNTTKGAPVSQVLKLTQGIIQRIEVQFPRGTYAKVHCAIMHGGHQAWPTNPEGNFASDGYVIPIDEYYKLDEPPFELKFLGWSEADTYPYDIDVRIGILRPEEIEEANGVVGSLGKFLKKIGFRS